MPTVEHVLRLVLPAGFELLAGEAGLLSEVDWVVTLKPTAPGFENLKGGEFALVDAAVAERLGATIPDLVASLTRRKVSAICVLGSVPENAYRLAQTNFTPLVRLPPSANLVSIEARIVHLINDERSELYQRERELSQELMEVALAGRGIAAILEKLHTLTGRSVYLVGPDLESASPESSQIGKRLKEQEKQVLKGIESASGSPPVAGIRLEPNLACFLGPVLVGAERKGYLVLTVSQGIAESDRMAVRLGILALAVEMSRRRAMEETEEGFQSEIMESLLQGDLASARVMGERALRIGLDLSQTYAVLVASAGDLAYSREVMLRKAGLALPGWHCHLHGGNLVEISLVDKAIVPGELRRMGTDAGRKLSVEFGAPMAAGIGRVYPAPDGIRLAFHEAEQALVMGTRLFGPGSVTFFGDLGAYRLLLSLKVDELKEFYAEYLGELARYDQKHGGDLLPTLEALVRHPTLIEAAAALHVHRNTLLYRLRRIKDISRMDLENSEVRLIAYLALRTGDVIRAT